MDKNFLLNTESAEILFHEYAKQMPIFDYHCHLIPEQIANNKRFDNISDTWLSGDHYKWRQMRTNGINEQLITGDADPYDKFYAWAGTMENLMGNPLYHWTHLELQRYFDIDLILNKKNAKEIYTRSNRILQSDSHFSTQQILTKFNVEALGTTDDPADSLEYHQKINKLEDFHSQVIPSFRPDKYINIKDNNFITYLTNLEKVSNIKTDSLKGILTALENRLNYFISLGCKASDHALTIPTAVFRKESEVESILQKRLQNKTELSVIEIEAYKTYILTNLARMYNKNNIAMQLHFATIRDNNPKMFKLLGADTGYDSVLDRNIAEDLASFFANLSNFGEIPKTIIYSANPKDYYPIGTLMGCYQGKTPGRIQLGTSWWFNDHKDGMNQQLKALGNIGMIPRFIGMVTDSRSFLSFPRHEYFRRILCNLFGQWIEDGEIPNDLEVVGKVVQNISFNNAKDYFNN